MKHLPYDNFNPREFIIRDWLALDRTVLANERTFLAYGRTTLTLVISGLSFIKFFGHVVYSIIGYVFIAGGLSIFFFGLKRYRKMKKHYHLLSEIRDEELPEQIRKETRIENDLINQALAGRGKDGPGVAS
ncbi:DUF202 domain-containing protein [Thermithiobacillus plumbiphilus]|uniref:DUF202 domain-containing protein n=1 Tax=Thermithiobacillus plumbiphilus TaxID=1729899 RepID=A0ABU9D4I1_9PROT